jgi:Na+/H+ antiporter NhaC
VLSAGSLHAAPEERIITLTGVPYTYRPTETVLEHITQLPGSVRVVLDGETVFEGRPEYLTKQSLPLTIERRGFHEIVVSSGSTSYTQEVYTLIGVLSILPPVVAIVFALVFRQVVVALLAGVWLGSFLVSGFQPIPSLSRIIDHYVLGTLAGSGEGADHISIIIFTLLLGGMVGITSRMGGMQGIVDRVSHLATTARRGQFAVWLMGVIIFFDDYTNTLIVGNSLRPLTDKLRISREKLSYIVDSTAAPITALAVITSWIGFEISLLDQSFKSLGIERNPLGTFVSSIPYSYYPILAILFVLFIILTGRDYSLMSRAERRARSSGKVSSDTALPLSHIDSEAIAAAPGTSPRWLNGVIPIAVVIGITFYGLIHTGRSAIAEAGGASPGLFEAIKESNSFTALLWGSFAGCIAAAVLALCERLLSLTETVTAWINGIRSMLSAIIILVLAWCIGKVCTELHTADYLVHNLSDILSPRMLPAITFLLAMGISFSTGTSWGTMSILIPIVIPLCYGIGGAAGLGGGEFESVLLSSIAAILSGAVFGDHCSPISDTTIMSSMASAADHIDHVRTQLPYAVTVGVASLIFGYLFSALGLGSVISLIIGSVALLGFVLIVGKPVNSPA